MPWPSPCGSATVIRRNFFCPSNKFDCLSKCHCKHLRNIFPSSYTLFIIGHDIDVGQNQPLSISGISRITPYQIPQLINAFSDTLRRLVSALLMYSLLDLTSLLVQIFILAEILNRTPFVGSSRKLDFSSGFISLQFYFGRLYPPYSHNKRTLSNNFSLLDRVRLSCAFGTECELSYTQPQNFS